MAIIGVGTKIDNRTVVSIGIPTMSGHDPWVTPVHFNDNTYGLAVTEMDSSAVELWKSDNSEVDSAISMSNQMPVAMRGLGSGVLNVYGSDKAGKYLIKLYYDDKKLIHNQIDRLIRS